MKIFNLKHLGLLLWALALSSPGVANNGRLIPFTTDYWDLEGGKIGKVDDRDVLTGTAVLRDKTFVDGIIEVDIKTNGKRGFPGVFFRNDGAGNSEYVYIRPHQSGRFEAIQYAATYNGQTGWQLYSGEGYTNAIDIPSNTWVTLRIEVAGSRARAYFGSGDSPVLVIDQLKGKSEPGGIALLGANGEDVYLSNFRLTKTSALTFPPARKKEQVTGIIDDWWISEAFPAQGVDLDQYPVGSISEISQKVQVEPSGLVNISRYRALVDGKPSVVYARTILHGDKKQRVKLYFGYSDEVTIFHNRQPVFHGNSQFRSRDPSFVGTIGYNDVLFLELEPGENEILVAVKEVFGGWGLQMKRENSQ